ncbi:MAG: hypothetical protein Q8L85_01950 [Alphaproteobacteria bacterium]|nr:hypothetical protein [Alphaproteobacteria bacterium]
MKKEHLELLPEDFDPIVYLRLNPDLDLVVKDVDQIEKEAYAKNHYLNHGKMERRKYFDLPEDFDPLLYIRQRLNNTREDRKNNLKLNSNKKAYIHIGYGKTGTTAIQKFFFNNYNILKNNKFLYPISAHKNNFEIAAIGKETEKNYNKKVTFIYENVINDMLHIDHDVLLISSEHFKNRPNRILVFLKELFFQYEIHIVLHIRDQIHLIQSAFTQEAKEGCYTFGRNPWDMYTRISDHFDFNNFIIEPWEKIFGQSAIKASLYHPEIIGKDVRHHFLKQIGINDPELISKLNFESEKDNPSIHPLLSDLIAKIDKNESLDNRPEIIDEILNISKHLKGIKHSLFTPEQEAEIKNYYAESNAAFADKYLTPREKELLLS